MYTQASLENFLFTLFSSSIFWPRRLSGKFIGGRRQFLVLVIKVETRFIPLSGWFLCTMAWKYRVSMKDSRHAILLSYGEGVKGFPLLKYTLERRNTMLGIW